MAFFIVVNKKVLLQLYIDTKLYCNSTINFWTLKAKCICLAIVSSSDYFFRSPHSGPAHLGCVVLFKYLVAKLS